MFGSGFLQQFFTALYPYTPTSLSPCAVERFYGLSTLVSTSLLPKSVVFHLFGTGCLHCGCRLPCVLEQLGLSAIAAIIGLF